MRTPAAILLLLSPLAAFAAERRELKPGFNIFTLDQDVQMGKESAAEVRNTQTVVDNRELTSYLARIGAHLAKSPRAGKFPFEFQVLNDRAINAFALPGGPIFVDTGLLAAIDNESQLAGVLAHEMSHIALRHGTHEASKAILVQAPAAFLEATIGDQSTVAKIAQQGIALGAQSGLLKYSRDAEREADLNGARIMNDAGYNPVEMARFFEKLQAQGAAGNGLLANWLSDHPAPGNRVQAVEDEVRYLPRASYHETDPRTLPRVKNIVAKLPPAPPKPAPANAQRATTLENTPLENAPPEKTAGSKPQ
jgi:predicted Zn-dependent protease